MKVRILLIFLLALLGCRQPQRQLVVLAAASLREVVLDAAQELQKTHQDLVVQTSFAGSQTLRMQLQQGLQADVVLVADDRTAVDLQHDGLATTRVTWACNRLVLVVPADNPAQIQSFLDLPKARRLVLGNPESPIGRYADARLAQAGLTNLQIVSREPDVRRVLTKVALGEADAALVYATDVPMAPKPVVAIELPEASTLTVPRNSALLVKAAANTADAQAFLDLVHSPAGLSLATKRGFRACPDTR